MLIPDAALIFDETSLQQKLDPEVLHSIYQDALDLLDAGELAGGLALMRGLVQRCPDNPDFLRTLGQVLSEAGALEESLIHFRKALQLRPDEALCHLGLGLTLMRGGNYDEAEAAFEKALALNPENDFALGNLASCLCTQNKSLPRAEDLVRKAIQISPDKPAFWITLGQVCQGQRKLAEAENAHTRALDLGVAGPFADHVRRCREAVQNGRQEPAAS
jgi:Flp pilus assembly protein TadD